MSNRNVRSKVIFGLQVIGAGTPITTIITGYRACGSLLPESVYFGHRDGGVGTTALTHLTKVTGDRRSVFTEALITVMATPETVTGADDGMETPSSTTPL